MNNIMTWLNGKKTSIACVFWLVQEAIIPVWFENGTPPTLDKILQTIAIILTAIGLGHKVKKGIVK